MRRVGMLVLLVAVAVTWFALVEPGSNPSASPPGQIGRTSAPAPSAVDGEQSLPREARDTIAAIDEGGPFRYDRDGAVFENRERHLPVHDRGYWREYTVRTPGSADRGARRLVQGAAGELYYTDDHYASFRQVRPPGGSS